jgi:hypothetical protein
VACRTLKQLRSDNAADRSVYLSTVFLSNSARVNANRPSLAYGLTVGIRVSDYEIGRQFCNSEHYEGGFLFRDTAIIALFPPHDGEPNWKVVHSWQSRIGEEKCLPVDPISVYGKVELDIPLEASGTPRFSGRLRLLAAPWNTPGNTPGKRGGRTGSRRNAKT